MYPFDVPSGYEFLPYIGVSMKTFDNIGDMVDDVMYLYGDVLNDVWVNLTNGAEAIGMLDNIHVPYNFCRFQSTYFEHKDWGSAIDAMPDDMLMRLALGYPQTIIDLGANKKCPRALRQGIPIAARMISQVWELPYSEHMYIFNRNGKPVQVDDDFARESMRLTKPQVNRLKYFKKYIPDYVDLLDITLLCAQSEHDNDYDFHVQQVHKSLLNSNW